MTPLADKSDEDGTLRLWGDPEPAVAHGVVDGADDGARPEPAASPVAAAPDGPGASSV